MSTQTQNDMVAWCSFLTVLFEQFVQHRVDFRCVAARWCRCYSRWLVLTGSSVHHVSCISDFSLILVHFLVQPCSFVVKLRARWFLVYPRVQCGNCTIKRYPEDGVQIMFWCSCCNNVPVSVFLWSLFLWHAGRLLLLAALDGMEALTWPVDWTACARVTYL